MVTKTISIKENVYDKLNRMKRPGESFSDLLDRLTEITDSTNILHQLRGSIEFDDRDTLISEIRDRRKEWRWSHS